MIIIDKALQKREDEGKSIRVAMVGAGFIGCGIARQIISTIKGMELVAIANRTLDHAKEAYLKAGLEGVKTVDTKRGLEQAIASGQPAVTEDPLLVCQAENIDAVIEATGVVELGAMAAMAAIKNGKHFVMNAELDATLGPILKVHGDRAGVIITSTDGDQPGVIMNLFRFVKTIGYQPVMAGNIKGYLNPYATPTTQEAFAVQYNHSPRTNTAFTDGAKISMEMAVVANATGFPVSVRGMAGPRCDHVKEAPYLFPLNRMLEKGLVDYIIGAEPGPGIFVLGFNENPVDREYMQYFKMGEGPVYLFYTPYHLTHLELPLTIARAVLFNDAAIQPLAGPVCQVACLAKRDLREGEILDGIGGYDSYGEIENSDIFQKERMLPMGLSHNCRVIKPIPKDTVITYNDVEIMTDHLIHRLKSEQDAHFFS